MATWFSVAAYSAVTGICCYGIARPYTWFQDNYGPNAYDRSPGFRAMGGGSMDKLEAVLYLGAFGSAAVTFVASAGGLISLACRA